MRGSNRRFVSLMVVCIAASLSFGSAEIEQYRSELAKLDAQINKLRDEVRARPVITNAEAKAAAAAKNAEKVKADPKSTPASRIDALNAFGKLQRELEQVIVREEKATPALLEALRTRDAIADKLESAITEAAKAEADRKVAQQKDEEKRRIEAAAASRLKTLPIYQNSRTWQLGEQAPRYDSIPLDPSDTPMSVVLQRSREFIDQPATVCVAVRATEITSPIYAARRNHYAFEIRQLDKAGRSAPPTCTAYLLTPVGHELLEVINHAAARNVDASVPMRLKMVVTRAPQIDRPTLEIVDWQFLASDSKSWGPWFSEADYIGLSYAVKYETAAREHQESNSFLADLAAKALDRFSRTGDSDHFVAEMDGIKQMRADEDAEYATKEREIMKAWVAFRRDNGLDAVAAATQPTSKP